MWWIKSYLWRHRLGILLCLVFGVIFTGTFYLYHLPVEAVGYAGSLCIVLAVLVLFADGSRYCRKLQELEHQQEAVRNGTEVIPQPADSMEKAYQDLLRISQEERTIQIAELMKEKTDVTDYFTMWAHQIKTPIAAIRLLQQGEPADLEQYYEQKKESEAELFKIEQYVEMVLQYLRLNSTINDFVLKEYALDDMIRQAVHKYAPMFIRRKLCLKYEPVPGTVITDEKWIVFVLEQLLSNAVKYTSQGTVSVYLESEAGKGQKYGSGAVSFGTGVQKICLIIEDTGIGILPEDLPRIFEKGYTGYNGRSDKKASGIGLYLCRMILEKLGHGIAAESEPGKGTRLKLMF